jgi:AcrR family transcriptional regulator
VTTRAQATRQRILEAAIGEFGARGASGARIDRIAAAACMNKQLIYAHFGSKQGLFEAAVVDQLSRFLAEVPFDPLQLPEFAAATFDYFTEEPGLARLAEWHSLETDQVEHPIEAIANAWRERVAAVADAQANGAIGAHIGAADLLLLTFSIARSWVIVAPEIGQPDPPAPEARREAVRIAVQALVAPSYA